MDRCKWKIIRKACLQEDEGRDSMLPMSFDTKDEAYEWIDEACRARGSYFVKSDYTVAHMEV